MGESSHDGIGAFGHSVDRRIDMDGIVAACVAEGMRHGWVAETLEPDSDTPLTVMRRCGEPDGKTLYVSAGMHGDEPAPPLAILRLLRRNAWSAGLNLLVCPCLNPTGFRHGRRENKDGIDLNRQYHLPTAAPSEPRKHVEWLRSQGRIDAALCLHEDWESLGFYLYELLRDERDSLARDVLESVKGGSAVDFSNQIDGMAAKEGVIAPRGDYGEMLQEWPEAIWLIENKTDLCYTFETSSANPLILRVAAQVNAVNTVAARLAESHPG